MNFLRKNIGLIYIFLLAIQVVLIAYYAVKSFQLSVPNYFYFESVALYFNDQKRVELLSYVIGIVLLGVYFLGIMILENMVSLKAKRYSKTVLSGALNPKNKKLMGITGLFLVVLPLLIHFVGKSFSGKLVFQMVVLLLGIALPFWHYFALYHKRTTVEWFYSKFKNHANNEPFFTKNYFFAAVLFVAFLQLLYLFYDPIANRPKIINEYFNIPESTVLKDGKNYDNTVYWQANFPSAMTFKNDIGTEQSISNCVFKSPEELGVLEPSLLDGNISYDQRHNLFCVNGLLDLNAFGSVQDSQLYHILQRGHYKARDLEMLSLSENDKDWLSYNKFEIHWQILSRFMIHHNSFLFIPIADFAQDKNISTINAQYGLGSAWVFHKLLAALNSISLDGWLKVSYLVYYVYFAIFIGVVFAITRNIAWTAIIFLLSLSVINYRGYDFLLLPPGESPWRHFFDILIVYLLFAYANYKRIIFYAAALLFGLGSIVLNPQIGLMIFLAALVSGVLYAYRERYRLKTTLILSLIALPVAGTIFVLTSSANDLASYYLDGVIGFPISFSQIFKIFLMIIVGYVVLWKILKDRLTTNYAHLVFLFLYVQALLLYVVWHYNTEGFKARAFIYILTAGLFAFHFRSMISQRYKNYIAGVIVAITVTVYVDSVSDVLKSKRQYEKIFDRHVTYEWNMDRAHIVSTMNPVYFQNGVDLIQKYSKGQNGIYIVSEYDNFLPFLAHKYSLMPFFDMKWYLITPKELNKSIQVLQKNKPEYLFVDTGIDRNLNNEIIDPKFPEIGYLNQESIWRVQRLKLMNQIFQSVADDYELVEQGYLISVYKRKK
ncbi:MAG: hypothetical protein AB1763_10435 [Campylobacterota bacterium]